MNIIQFIKKTITNIYKYIFITLFVMENEDLKIKPKGKKWLCNNIIFEKREMAVYYKKLEEEAINHVDRSLQDLKEGKVYNL